MRFDNSIDEKIHIRNCAYGFSCDQNWDGLEETSDESIKYCSLCRREVHWCVGVDELVEFIALNRCIGFPESIGGGIHPSGSSAATANSASSDMFGPPDVDDFDDDIPF
jgi:hypothetical protein